LRPIIGSLAKEGTVKKLRWLGVALAAAFATTVAAQAPDFEVERLQLDPAARGSLVVGTGEVAPAHSFRISAGVQREHRPLVLVGTTDLLGRRSGAGIQSVIEDRDTLHLMLDYVLFPRVEIYGRANVILDQEGPGGDTESSGWGGPSFGVRLGALQQSAGAPLNVAFAAELFPKWGDSDLLARPGEPAGLFRVELGRDLGESVVLGLEVGYLHRDEQTIGVRELGSEIRYGAVLAGKGWLRPELSYRGAFGVTGDEDPGSGELLAGLRLDTGPVEIFGLGGPGFFNRLGTPEWRALAGVAIKRDAKQKKEEPAPAPAPAPPPPADPCAPGQTHTPEQCPDLDDDGDGVINRDDACPTVAGSADHKGCPPKDTDGDGVLDEDDACPAEAGLTELKGCPARDTDGDGVADHLDKCPAESGPADNEGCPRAVVSEKKIELREKVQFATGKATILEASTPLLDEIARILQENPQITRVLVEGHTDSTGTAALNQRLSQARADAVVNELVKRGVAKERLAAKGFGPSRPIASNDTPEGREANRRVEISIDQMN
jgi:OOP family OmpA-OmpF porin